MGVALSMGWPLTKLENNSYLDDMKKRTSKSKHFQTVTLRQRAKKVVSSLQYNQTSVGAHSGHFCTFSPKNTVSILTLVAFLKF